MKLCHRWTKSRRCFCAGWSKTKFKGSRTEQHNEKSSWFRKITYVIVFECWYGLCSKHISCDNRPILKSYVLNVNLIVNSRAQHQREQTFDIQNLWNVVKVLLFSSGAFMIIHSNNVYGFIYHCVSISFLCVYFQDDNLYVLTCASSYKMKYNKFW